LKETQFSFQDLPERKQKDEYPTMKFWKKLEFFNLKIDLITTLPAGLIKTWFLTT